MEEKLIEYIIGILQNAIEDAYFKVEYSERWSEEAEVSIYFSQEEEDKGDCYHTCITRSGGIMFRSPEYTSWIKIFTPEQLIELKYLMNKIKQNKLHKLLGN